MARHLDITDVLQEQYLRERWDTYVRDVTRDRRAPVPPEFLVGALHDRVHVDLPGGRAARTVRNTARRCGRCNADTPDCVCPEAADA